MMSRPKVFVTREIPAAGLDRVREATDMMLWPESMPPNREQVLANVAECEGILSLLTVPLDAEVMDAAPRLKVISNYAVGFNNVDIDAATARGVAVGNTPDVLTEATADMAFCLLIAAARRIVEGHAHAVAGHWKTWEPLGHIGQDLIGKTVGVVGMGRIGQALARRCHGGWGMTVLYADQHDCAAADAELGARRVDLDTLLSSSDFVSVHTDLNDSTRGLFDRAAFARMKPTAIFVNTARGGVMVEEDLVAALRDGEILAAGLDVTDPEPPAPDAEILHLPNAIVCPHIASATVASRDGMAEIAADNLIAGLTGTDLRHCVNPEYVRNVRKSP